MLISVMYYMPVTMQIRCECVDLFDKMSTMMSFVTWKPIVTAGLRLERKDSYRNGGSTLRLEGNSLLRVGKKIPIFCRDTRDTEK